MTRLLGAVLLALLAAPPAMAYDENRNWLNAYGRTVEHFSAPDRSIGNAITSAQNVLGWAAQAGRAPDRGAQQTGAWPWNGDAERGSYDARGSWTGEKVQFEFTGRHGLDLAGTVWAPSPQRLAALGLRAPLPGLVYAGGVISSQPMYYWFAQEMADAGYAVMTYDVDGQGRSEGSRVAHADDDLRDALDFFLSTPASPYRTPAAGGPAHNPLHALLDRGRIGTAGHSMGAGAVQSVGSHGGVVDAISAHSDLRATYASDVPIQGQGADYETFVFPPQPTPGTDPAEKLAGFTAVRARGVDVQEIVIESGSHMAWSHVTWAYTSAWSEAVATWYALAWFDRYLYDDIARRDGIPAKRKQGGVSATRRLTADYDAVGEHGLSQKYRSAYALRDLDEPAAGYAYTCEDMTGRAGCTQPKASSGKKRRAKRGRAAGRRR